jgi:hypothetical protein
MPAMPPKRIIPTKVAPPAPVAPASKESVKASDKDIAAAYLILVLRAAAAKVTEADIEAITGSKLRGNRNKKVEAFAQKISARMTRSYEALLAKHDLSEMLNRPLLRSADAP